MGNAATRSWRVRFPSASASELTLHASPTPIEEAGSCPSGALRRRLCANAASPIASASAKPNGNAGMVGVNSERPGSPSVRLPVPPVRVTVAPLALAVTPEPAMSLSPFSRSMLGLAPRIGLH
jgi:hypothetical protein